MIVNLGLTAILLGAALFWSMAAFPPVAQARQAVTWLVWLTVGVAICRIWFQ
jgi:hypothetical protein